MSSEIVTLYTSANLEDPNPQAFQYYLDYEGSQCLQVAMQNLGIQVDPNLYGLLLRSDEIKWIEPTATLRSQGVTTGCMIVIYPYNTENAQEQQQQQQQPETQEVKLPKIIQASDYEVAPTVYVDDEYRTNPNIYNTLPHDDSDGEFDIHIDTGVADFATNNFGGLRASDFTFIEGETQEPTNEKDKSVNIYTSNGFSTENPKQCQYNLSYSFDDMLAAALRHLGLNKDGRYALLLQYGNDDRRWFGETNYLEDYNPFNGMTLYVFKRERTIRVHSAISHSIPLNLDLTKTVAELVKDVASNFNIENYHGYTLCSIQDKRTQTLNRELSIPQQTKSIRDIYFLRKYLLFSREDLSTLESTKIAYKDAFNEFIKDHINLNPTDAAELIVYQLYAEAEPGKEPDFGSLPDDLSKRLPKSFKDSKKIGSKVKEVAQSIGKLDQFNGCRKFIQKVRRMQGFATKKFDRVKIELKFQGKKTVVEVTVLISPLTITLINPKTGTIEEKISISRIVCMNLLSHQLEIQFSIMRSLGKIGKYILHSSEVPKIKTLIEEYSDVSKQILIQRAQARAAEFGEGVAAIDPRSKISLFTASELDAVEPKSYDYDSKFTGKTLLQYAEQYLNIPHDDDHVVLVKLMKKSYRWITNDMILSLANVQDGMTVYILKNKKPMKILFADGSTKTVLMDITKTIEEIIPMLFEKLSLPEIAGYTLYTIDEKTGEQQPLDTRFSIPEQCKY
ncbi:hypothetical protein GPJ56_003135 [Histomonas meleagridis]|nr:hypothetical protein GPJ56_003135 [Histomonas meleagridis]